MGRRNSSWGSRYRQVRPSTIALTLLWLTPNCSAMHLSDTPSALDLRILMDVGLSQLGLERLTPGLRAVPHGVVAVALVSVPVEVTQVVVRPVSVQVASNAAGRLRPSERLKDEPVDAANHLAARPGQIHRAVAITENGREREPSVCGQSEATPADPVGLDLSVSTDTVAWEVKYWAIMVVHALCMN